MIEPHALQTFTPLCLHGCAFIPSPSSTGLSSVVLHQGSEMPLQEHVSGESPRKRNRDANISSSGYQYQSAQYHGVLVARQVMKAPQCCPNPYTCGRLMLNRGLMQVPHAEINSPNSNPTDLHRLAIYSRTAFKQLKLTQAKSRCNVDLFANQAAHRAQRDRRCRLDGALLTSRTRLMRCVAPFDMGDVPSKAMFRLFFGSNNATSRQSWPSNA
jgi:hypothetical protein